MAESLAGSSLNTGAIPAVVPPEHARALVMAARVVPKSGQHTSGLDRLGNGSHRRAAKALEISTLAWLDLPDNCADGLRVAQPPPRAAPSAPETTRMAVALTPRSRVGQAQEVRFLRYVLTDGAYRTQKFVAGVRPGRCIRLVWGAPLPLGVLSARIPRPRGRTAHTAPLARVTGAIERAVRVLRPQTRTGGCPIRFSTTGSGNVPAKWGASSPYASR
jgi:LmbE family N-acetylglucosaminyl deacetylase